MCLNCFITSACERNGIVGALRSSQSYTIVILSSLYLGMKNEGLWTSVLCVGRKETRAMITFSAVPICCYTGRTSSLHQGDVRKT